ncbi:unnamed protein product [Porites evermanni]|uniref:F5/8 type C domain-containing protein n=1 Tax=Porites evermanni TaxID=104178 RepID=A0ABN8MH44_9CNID|nr:unnamed protein product [Porites evermanni]
MKPTLPIFKTITCQDLSTNRKKGTPTCMPVGVASTSKIPDAKMTASTFHRHNSGNHWVTSYKLNFSSNAITWKTYNENNAERVFSGNQDRNTIVKHSLRHNVKARFVRFYPVSHYSHPCLRVEIFVLK